MGLEPEGNEEDSEYGEEPDWSLSQRLEQLFMDFPDNVRQQDLQHLHHLRASEKVTFSSMTPEQWNLCIFTENLNPNHIKIWKNKNK